MAKGGSLDIHAGDRGRKRGQHVQQRDAVNDPVQHVHVLRRRCHRAVQYLTRGARA